MWTRFAQWNSRETVLADLTDIWSFNKQSLFAGNLVKTTKRRILPDNLCSKIICSKILKLARKLKLARNSRETWNSRETREKLARNSRETVLADLTDIWSFNKQSLFAGNLVKTTKRRILPDNLPFHRSFAVSGGLALLRAFLSVGIEHQVPFFYFSFFFCHRFHTDALNLSHA